MKGQYAEHAQIWEI